MGTYMGLAVPLYSDSGAEIMSVASDGTVTFLTAVALTQSLSSSATSGGLIINVTSTGAIAVTGTAANGIVVSASSKSTLNSVVQYSSGKDADSAVSFLAVSGTKAPTYLLKVGNSAFGIGAAADNGFFDASMSFSVFPTSAVVVAGLKILSGTKAYFIIAYPDTTFA